MFTCDVGTPTAWAAWHLYMNGKRRLIGSFNHGSMANALPQAIGAQASYPGQQVISLLGDGEHDDGRLHHPPPDEAAVKVIVRNNVTLGFVELEMKATGILTLNATCANRISRPWRRRWHQRNPRR